MNLFSFFLLHFAYLGKHIKQSREQETERERDVFVGMFVCVTWEQCTSSPSVCLCLPSVGMCVWVCVGVCVWVYVGVCVCVLA